MERKEKEKKGKEGKEKEAWVLLSIAPHRRRSSGGSHKKKKARGFLLELSLGGDYLRLPMSLTIGVEGLRALGGTGRGAETKKETQIALSLLRGRLPTLPLSQYHRRGEA